MPKFRYGLVFNSIVSRRMIARIALFLALVASAAAFALSNAGVRSTSRRLSMSAERSQALPFLKRPTKVISGLTKDTTSCGSLFHIRVVNLLPIEPYSEQFL